MDRPRSYFREPRVWLAIALPIAAQLVFFLIMLPALQGTESRIGRLHIAVVSQDPAMGTQIAQQLAGRLPFAVDRPPSLAEADRALHDGAVQMVVVFPANFSQALRAGKATLRYQISPSAAVMTGQVMTQVARSMTEQVNAMAFAAAQQAVARGVTAALQAAPVAPAVATQLADRLAGAIRSLVRSPVTADLGAGAAATNPLQAIVPMYVILLGFGGAVGALALLWLTPLSQGRWAVFGNLQLALAIVAALLPVVTISLLALFGQAFPQGSFAAWWALALAYWAMLLFVAALVRLLGRLGLVVAGLALPFQVIAAGVFLPAALLPGFYSWLARFTPGPYAARSLLNVLAGDPVAGSTIRALAVVVVASLLVSVVATALPRKVRTAVG